MTATRSARLFSLLSFAALGSLAGLASPAMALDGKVVATGFASPTALGAPRGDNRLFVVEQGGLIHTLSASGKRTYLDLRDLVATTGERGLLGLAFDPDFASNGRFYVNYVDKTTLNTVVARFRAVPPSAPSADPATRQTILSFPQEPFENHKGGWIGFRPGNAANLYIATGDGGSGYDPNNNGQDGTVLLGKMLRIDVSGSGAGYTIPADNPFADGVAARPEIWALGLRNPFRNSFDRQTGDFWIADVGQDTREEIDFEKAGDPGGHNYGWRLREGTVRTPIVGGNKPGLTNPVFDYTHLGTPGGLGNSIIGGYVYRGPAVPGANGRYFFGDFVANKVFSFTYAANGRPTSGRDDTTALIGGTGLEGVTTFGEDGDGRLYVAGYNGVVVVMCPSAGEAQAAGRPEAPNPCALLP